MVSGSCKNRQSIDYVARKVETYAAMRGCVDRFRNVFPYGPREIALWGKKWRLSVPGPYGGLTRENSRISVTTASLCVRSAIAIEPLARAICARIQIRRAVAGSAASAALQGDQRKK